MLTIDGFAQRELMTQDCDLYGKVDKTVKVSCDNFVITRKRLQIKIVSATYGRANSATCLGRLEDRCYDFDQKITDIVASK